MFDQTTIYWAVTGLIFASVALASFGATLLLTQRSKVRQRFGTVSAGLSSSPAQPQTFGTAIRATLRPDRIGVDAGAQKRLRNDLIKAGFFSQEAATNFTLIRLALVVFLPAAFYFAIASTISELDPIWKFLILAVAFLFSYYLPQAYIDRRKRLLQDRYRIGFPDFLDLLVVCVDAGLSLDAALERVAIELGSKDPELRANLSIMSGEMRAGRGTIEALRNFADRLGLDEAHSLAVLLQQSLELGTDVAQALATYSEEMRDKRAARAEQKAYALPVKLTLPLGVFIFPVLMIVIMTPVLIRILKAFSNM